MGMNVVCPSCGHSEPSSNRRGACIGPCPECGAPGQARSREAAGMPGPAAGNRPADKTPGRALRQAAHFYLGHGLLPVPAWAARADGSCCCPRGADCPRPGKHPRSVHVGPGERDYSWKPLACRTNEEVEQRFADSGPYAEANLMLAIPPGMLAVDQDDDDGGPQAIATLAAQLGDLPATLAHKTPHGVHHIYRTPPGWTGRAWVGKDARNPLPAGIDLRVPGQILMAAPSQVPAPGGMAAYGPATGANIADLPAAYVKAWTPPQTRAARPQRPVPVPSDRSGTAARYVHNKITGILADLEGEHAARNTALYTAALKIGSTLGAARATPGAEHAAAGWTGQSAEDALMAAAETNGYLAKDGPAAARTAIRSGLRNGLRNPRPLPDFTGQPTAPPAAHSARRGEPGGQARTLKHARAAPLARSEDASPRDKTAQPEDTRPVPLLVHDDTQTQNAGTGAAWAARPAPRALKRQAPDVRSVSAVLHAAGFVASSEALKAVHVPEGYQVQVTPEGHVLVRHVAIDEPVKGVSPSARTERMLTSYACALRVAGFHVASRTRDSLIAQPEAARQATSGREHNGQAAGKQVPASSAAVANDAYRTAYRVVAGNARPRQPIGQPVRERAREPGTGAQAGRTRAEPQPPSPDDTAVVLRGTVREPEMPPSPPKPETRTAPKAGPQVTADPAPPPDRAKDLDREREASG